MARQVVVADQALHEIDEAVKWYDRQDPGLGDELFRAIQDAVGSIRTNPEIHPLRFDEVRRVMLKRFPYSIYFEHDQRELRILSVFHHARDPSNLKKLKNP